MAMKRYFVLGLISIGGAVLVLVAIYGYQELATSLAGGNPGTAVPIFHEGDQPVGPLRPLPNVDALAKRLSSGQEAYEKVRDDALAVYAKRHPGVHQDDEEVRESLKLMSYLWTWGDFYGENLLPNLANHARHLNHGESADPVWDVANDVDWYDVYYSSCDNDAGRNMTRADALSKTDYPAAFRLWAYQRAAANLITAEGHDDARTAMGASLKRLPEMASKAVACYSELVAQHFSNRTLYAKGRQLLGATMKDLAALETVSKGLDDAFIASDRDNPTAQLLDVLFYIDKGWGARGGGYSDTVSDKGWRTLGENMQHAGEMLKDMYARDPEQPGLSRCMMHVVQALQLPRDQMELWYARAMKTDPNDFDACQEKEYYLLPRWYGTEEDEWKFGQECVQSSKWSEKIPMILVEELDYRVESEPDVYAQDEVWKSLEKIYREFLSRFPDSIYYRTHFAQDARLGRHWEVAKEQLKILGADYSRDVFSDKGFEELKAEVAAH